MKQKVLICVPAWSLWYGVKDGSSVPFRMKRLPSVALGIESSQYPYILSGLGLSMVSGCFTCQMALASGGGGPLAFGKSLMTTEK